MGQLTQIAVIKMLLDSCAAVCVGPTMALTHENLMLEKSKCRIITADGSIVDVDGTLGFFFEDPNVVLVLVLIKDDFFIKRMLTQKASIYPGFILMPVFTS